MKKMCLIILALWSTSAMQAFGSVRMPQSISPVIQQSSRGILSTLLSPLSRTLAGVMSFACNHKFLSLICFSILAYTAYTLYKKATWKSEKELLKSTQQTNVPRPTQTSDSKPVFTLASENLIDGEIEKVHRYPGLYGVLHELRPSTQQLSLVEQDSQVQQPETVLRYPALSAIVASAPLKGQDTRNNIVQSQYAVLLGSSSNN